MSEFKQCPNGHYYKGDTCPYCMPKRPAVDSKSVQLPYKDKCSANSTEIPICKHCGQRLRRNIPSLVGAVSNIQDSSRLEAPWNYNWDGKCEYFGHDYAFHVGLQINDDALKTIKRTFVSADCMGFAVPGTCDKYTVLSGITIKTYVGEAKRGEVFLSSNELKKLIDLLKDSPLLEQFDYKFDPEAY